MTYSIWIENKNALAHTLANGCCGGAYADGAIILCTSISAMASLMWVRADRTDKKRFIEIVARFPKDGFRPTTVSAPLLAQEDDSLRQKLAVSDKAFRYDGSVDKSENEVVGLCSTSMSPLDCRKFVRKYSYASLLYEHVRCGFIHTYKTTDSATSDDALRGIFGDGGTTITYVNGTVGAKMMRKIHFPLGWISRVAKAVALGLDIECERDSKVFGQNLDRVLPSTWWIDGA
jgi:hypothetical protein